MKRVMLLVIFLFSVAFLSAQTPYSIEVNAGYCATTGDFGDLFSGGFGATAALQYSLTEKLQLSLNTGFTQLPFNDDKFTEALNAFLEPFGERTEVKSDVKMTVIPLVAGLRYYFGTGDFRPYAEALGGVHFVKTEASSITVGEEKFEAVASKSEAAGAGALGLGFLYDVSPAVALNFNARLNTNGVEVGYTWNIQTQFGTSSSQEMKTSVIYFSIMAGVQIAL